MSSIFPSERFAELTAAAAVDQQPVSGAMARHRLHRPFLVARILAVVLALSAAVVGTLVVSARAVGAQDDEVKLKSVRFDLGRPAGGADDPLSAAGAVSPVRYRSIVVVDGGEERRLQPLDGQVATTADQADIGAMAVELDGTSIGSAADGFTDSLASAAASAVVDHFVRFAPGPSAGPLSIDLTYSRPLTPDDYLLVQEGRGDSALDLAPLGPDGSSIGRSILVGPKYQLNTGHAPPDDPAWASVIPVRRFATEGRDIAAIRVSGFGAEFKIVPLMVEQTGADEGRVPVADQPAPVDPPAPVPVVAAAPADQPVYAAIGLDSKIQPAVAVGGAGCADPVDQAATVPVEPGQSVTFCFTVTNLGTSNLTDIQITDHGLGLVDAKLPKAAGPDILAPGQQAVFYHHSVAEHRAASASAEATARPADGAGGPIAGLVAPSGSSTPGPVGDPSAVPVSEQQAEPVPPVAATAPVEAPGDDQATTAASEQVPASGLPTEALEVGAITQLAHTGVPTAPWILVILAMGFIFFGYTVYVAFRTRPESDEPCGHAQLDALGFD